MNEIFSRIAVRTADYAGRPLTFIAALGSIILWGLTGPLFAFSDTWQLVVNTGTTVITFLMVFLIQNAQNRDTKALQLKLDELIRATEGARNSLIELEERTEDELKDVKARMEEDCIDDGLERRNRADVRRVAQSPTPP